MPFSPLVQRLEPERSATWPQSNSILRAGMPSQRLQESLSAPATAMPIPFNRDIHPTNISSPNDSYEDELDKHPEDYFLSPASMYDYDDWADSDSDDDEQVEWNAGIVDFALFDDDRRRAQGRYEDVPDRWNQLLSNQASALQRAVERNRADSQDLSHRSWAPLFHEEDVPQLTPDNSPDMRDDSHLHTYCGPKSARLAVPHLQIIPPQDDLDDEEYDDDDDEDEDSEDDDLPISVLIDRSRARRQAALKKERPGLRFTRTMSGKNHSWRRPGRQIYSVGEEPEAEKHAEQLCVQRSESDDERGRRR